MMPATFVTFLLGKNCEANMPIVEGLPNETFNIGDEKKVYITKVEKTTKGPKVFLSRTNKEIVKRLFENEIPEIIDGTVMIYSVAREVGRDKSQKCLRGVDGGEDGRDKIYGKFATCE